jgi:anti-sigma regulatory factor (Ser/Thr protein kinase)
MEAVILQHEPCGSTTSGAEPADPAEGTAAATRHVFPVGEWGDVAIARHQARRLAREHGAEPRRAGEVAIVVSELASNIVKYGVRGEIAIHVVTSAGGGDARLTVVARDIGPPIHDLATALRDGHDDRGPLDAAALVQRGGLGTGLGAVARLSDNLEVRQDAGGKQIIATFSRGLTRGA